MKFISKYEDYINEARLKKSDDVNYEEKQTKGLLSKVILTLKKQKGSAIAKLIKQYSKMDQDLKVLQEERDSLNDTIKEKVADLFDVEDSAVTRIIESANFSITLSKNAEKVTRTVNHERIYSKLVELHPEIENTLNDLKEQYTTIKNGITPEKITKYTIQEAVISEGLISTILNSIKKFINKAKQAFSKFDQGMDEIHNMMKEAGL